MSSLVARLIEAIDHQKHGDAAQAEAIYRSIIAQDPEQPNALYLYALLQLKDGRAAPAAALLDRATLLRDDIDVWLNLARARLASGDGPAALAAARTALAKGGPRPEALYLEGTALNACSRPAEAAIALQQAAQQDPAHAPTRLNLGNALADLDRLEEAEAHIQTARQLDPALLEAEISLGFVAASRGCLPEAIAACKRAIALDPASGEAHWNLATALLLAGDYPSGFTEYEWRRTHPRFRHSFRNLPGPAWDGAPLEGRTLLVHAEQGLGDTIQFARYIPILRENGSEEGAEVTFACDPALVPLFRNQPGFGPVVPRTERPPRYDCWVDQMSLPRLLGTTATAIPDPGFYLLADPTRQRGWQFRLPGVRTDLRSGAARIGLVWAGNPDHTNDSRRSLPQAAVEALAAGPHAAAFVSLQLGPRAAEATKLGLLDASLWLHDYAETASLVATLDLVITVDTSIAHLAGALGVPVWIMLPAAPDWRWMLNRDDTPWYRTARLFRQTSPGDWKGVIDRIIAELDRVEAFLSPRLAQAA